MHIIKDNLFEIPLIFINQKQSKVEFKKCTVCLTWVIEWNYIQS